MPRYVIEREIPGAGQLSAAELRVASQRSLGVLKEMHDVTWIHSYVTDDKMYCIYDAPNPEVVHVHAGCVGIPATRVSEVRAMIDPSTAEG